ncbi:hypothetical protein [Staphylococcus aureus]|uniref:hypothetical protein n=1 Tax=Staphylococcus aureus TaxID=1280 RepID=UPI0032198EA0
MDWLITALAAIAATASAVAAWTSALTSRRAAKASQAALTALVEVGVEEAETGWLKGVLNNNGPAVAAGVTFIPINEFENHGAMFFPVLQVGQSVRFEVASPFGQVSSVHLIWTDGRGELEKRIFDRDSTDWPPKNLRTLYVEELAREELNGQEPKRRPL